MLKFDPTKVKIDFYQLKAVSTVLGGSISVIDEDRTEGKKEVMKRMRVPLSVTRSFIQKTKKVMKYLKPTWVAVASYDGHVFAMERHPLASMGALQEDGRKWVPMMQSLLNGRVLPTVKSNPYQWYFDGRYVYNLGCTEPNLPLVVRNGQFMTQDGHFRKITAYSIDMQMLDDKDGLDTTERHCLAFVAKDRAGVFNISPPIWKNMTNVGMTKLRGMADKGGDDDDDSEDENDGGTIPFVFDEIDSKLAVNLNFALKAGNEIGKTFGYEYVEPLHLPRLMIELHTTNLPNVSKQIKATYDISLQFTHALAWLLGLQRRAQTLDTLLMVRSLMKYLTKKGIFKADVFQSKNVFQDGKTFDDLTAIPLEALLENQDLMENTRRVITAALAEKAAKKRRSSSADDDLQTFSGMQNEED